MTTNFHPVMCGVGDHTLRLASELRARSIETRVFARPPAHSHPEDSGVAVVPCMGRTAMELARSIRSAILEWGATDALVQYVPHALGASRFGSLAIPLLCRALRRGHVRVTIFAHELNLPWRWRPDLALGSALNRIQVGALIIEADHFIVTTESRFAMVARLARMLRRADRLAMVPVGANATPTPARLSPDRFALGTFSTRTPNKRFDIVLDAFALVAARVPTATLLLIGDIGNQGTAFARDLDARVRSHPAAGRIHVTGRLPLPEISRLVAGLDAFLFSMDVGATTRSGTLPLALGAGVPVIARRGVDTGAVFVPDTNIIFADDLSGSAFASAVLRLRSEPTLRDRIAAGGRALFDEHLSWRAIGDRILSVMSETVPA